MSLLNKLSIANVDVSGKDVLMRVDFNVPMNKADGSITNNARITAAIPTVVHALKAGASHVVLMSHLGRPSGNVTPSLSLKVVADELSSLLAEESSCAGVEFVGEYVKSSEAVKAKITSSPVGTVFLLENLRFFSEEEGKGKDSEGNKVVPTEEAVAAFRSTLSSFGDVYVNDAFGTAHRGHSSMVGINLPIRAAGLLLQKELTAFASILDNPKAPVLAILGGAKVTDKIKLVENLLPKCDHMLIVGGMAFTFLSVNNGLEYGSSLYDEAGAETVPKIMELAKEHNCQLHFPMDWITADKFSADATVGAATTATGIAQGLMGLDQGAASNAAMAEVIAKCETIVWNGPAGVFEFPSFATGTKALLDSVIAATVRGATTIIGGGDTATAAKKWGAVESVTHVSTGGGASLELMEGKTLPGIGALSSA